MFTPQWRGGLYYAVQSRKAVTAEQQAATGFGCAPLSVSVAK